MPDLSDRLLSERLKELEAEGSSSAACSTALPVRVEYALTSKGMALEPAVRALEGLGQPLAGLSSCRAPR